MSSQQGLDRTLPTSEKGRKETEWDDGSLVRLGLPGSVPPAGRPEQSPPAWVSDLAAGLTAYYQGRAPLPDLPGAIDVSATTAFRDAVYADFWPAVIDGSIDGVTADWEQVNAELPAAALGKTVIIEFRLTTDELNDVDRAGFYVDDIQVTAP